MSGRFVAFVGEAGSAGSGLLLVFLAAGTVVVVVVLGAFLFGGRFAGPPRTLSGEEFEELRRRAEARISALAPGAILLSEKERAAGPGATGRNPEAGEFWRRFGGASGLIEEDPAAALQELRNLPALLGRALESADREIGRAGCVDKTEVGR